MTRSKRLDRLFARRSELLDACDEFSIDPPGLAIVEAEIDRLQMAQYERTRRWWDQTLADLERRVRAATGHFSPGDVQC